MKGIRIIEAKDDPTLLTRETGSVRNNVLLTLHPEDVERVRLGFVCIKCLEPQREAFPEKCSLCNFPIRAEQSDYFRRFYEGETRVGPSTNMNEELDRLDDWHERRLHVPGAQILIPRSLKIEGKKVKATGRLHTFGGS